MEKCIHNTSLRNYLISNPATAGKGLTILVENEILYKKRGLGMFVTENAKDKILATRRTDTLNTMARKIVIEAKRLAV